MGGDPQIYVHLHTNPAVGWTIAEKLALGGQRFPRPLVGRDSVVLRAYLKLLEPTRSDLPIEKAKEFVSGPSSAILKALLIAGVGKSPEEHLEVVASKSGVPLDLLSAFEILFFNVLDRHQDWLYLAEIAYPQGRPVTFDATYFRNTSVEDLLIRAGYDTRDVDFVEYLAGLEGKRFLKALKKSLHPESDLTKRLTAGAQLQIDTGLLHQKTPALDRAIGLLEPARRSKPAPICLEVPPDYDWAGELEACLKEAWEWDARPFTESGVVKFVDDPPVEKDTVVMFEATRTGVWKNKDQDKPVEIVGEMTSPCMATYYLTKEKSGIPASEVIFDD